MKRAGSFALASIVCLGLVALHLWSLLRYPAPFADEAWYAGRAWAFMTSGKPFGPLDAGVFERFPAYASYYEWLPAAIQSIALRFVTRPELLPLRILSLGFGMFLLVAVGLIGSHLGRLRLAIVSVLLTAVSEPFFYSAHMTHYDVMAAALGFFSIGLLLRNSGRRLWVSAAAGLVLVASFEMNPSALIFGPVIVAVGVAEWGWSFLASRDFWAFGAATLFGLLCYAAVHVLPNPTTYLIMSRLIYGPAHLPPILSGSLTGLLRGLQDEASFLLHIYLLAFFVVIWAAIGLAFSDKRNDRVLSVMAVALMLSQALLIRDKAHYYAILVTPGLNLLLAAFLLRCVKSIQDGPSFARIAASLAVLATLDSFWAGLPPLKPDGYQNYVLVQDRIEADVRPTDVIMASQTWWFGLCQHTYYSWEQLAYYQIVYPGCGLSDAMAHFRPNVFIVDGHLQEFITEQKASEYYAGILDLPGPELDEILASRATLVDQFQGGAYGQVSVYRLGWPKPAPGSTKCRQ